ncbi:MAG: 3-hydroxyacyl-ACP dehydratase FabZ [Victivallaceae bacterium]
METSRDEPVIGFKEIIALLPHRYPFLLVDKVLSVDLESSAIVAQKNVTVNEPFFVGHFPEVPIMPGVLILEALAQASGILLGLKLGERRNKKLALFLGIEKARFRNVVVPGDSLILHSNFALITGKGGKTKVKAVVGSKVAAEAECSFALVDKDSM